MKKECTTMHWETKNKLRYSEQYSKVRIKSTPDDSEDCHTYWVGLCRVYVGREQLSRHSDSVSYSAHRCDKSTCKLEVKKRPSGPSFPG